MSIDFCNTGLVTEITSSAGECDGYAVDNLITAKDNNQKGFLVDYFIKPPVTITIKFSCRVSINRIVLWPEVGSQKTIGVEVLTCYDKSNVYQSVGIGFLKNNEKGFLFHRHGDSSVEEKGFFTESFKSSKYLRAECVSIRIIRTLASTVPAMKRVEIWGDVCDTWPSQLKDTVLNIWSRISHKRKLPSKDHRVTQASNSGNSVLHSETNKSKFSGRNFNIPEEFLDPITFEIMTIPVTLPCGKNIDSSTLEKFTKEEEKWGRSPSDPFTGRIFTELSRPKVSISLKTRIDKFIIDNSNEKVLKTVPRIVGNSSDGPQMSRLLCSDKSLTDIVRASGSKETNLRKRKSESDVILVNPEFSKTEGVQDEADKHSKVKSFSELKEESLNKSLNQALLSLPSFKRKATLPENTVLCSKCTVNSSLYELPCKHYLCRICLSNTVSSKHLKCLKCNLPFNTNDPRRVHSNE